MQISSVPSYPEGKCASLGMLANYSYLNHISLGLFVAVLCLSFIATFLDKLQYSQEARQHIIKYLPLTHALNLSPGFSAAPGCTRFLACLRMQTEVGDSQ